MRRNHPLRVGCVQLLLNPTILGCWAATFFDDLSLQSRHSAIGQFAPKAILRVAALKAFSREFQSAAGGAANDWLRATVWMETAVDGSLFGCLLCAQGGHSGSAGG